MSSVGSNCSSVTFRGEEVDVSQALDELFREIQDNLNHTHCSVRQLAQCEERADTFIESATFDFEIQDHVDTLLSLFKELQSVSKDVLGKPPAEYRDEYKKMVEDRKANKAAIKAREKEFVALAKQVSKMQIITE